MLLKLLITLLLLAFGFFWLAWFFAPYFIVFLLYTCATLQDSLATLMGLLVVWHDHVAILLCTVFITLVYALCVHISGIVLRTFNGALSSPLFDSILPLLRITFSLLLAVVLFGVICASFSSPLHAIESGTYTYVPYMLDPQGIKFCPTCLLSSGTHLPSCHFQELYFSVMDRLPFNTPLYSVDEFGNKRCPNCPLLLGIHELDCHFSEDNNRLCYYNNWREIGDLIVRHNATIPAIPKHTTPSSNLLISPLTTPRGVSTLSALVPLMVDPVIRSSGEVAVATKPLV